MVSSLAPRHPRMFILSPKVVFQAQANYPGPDDYPLEFIAYDTVTLGDYTDILEGMVLCLGTTPGASDLGRQRIIGEATDIAIYLAYSSRGVKDGELLAVDNAYITVLDLRMIWSKISFIDASGEIFKDGGLEVGDNTENPPPVSNCGRGTASDAVGGVLNVLHNGQNSFAVADGATITDYLWTIGEGGTLLAGSLTDSFITVAYEPGFRYTSLTVTDSNGKSHTSYCPVFVDDPDNRQSIDGFNIVSHTFSNVGQTLVVQIYDDLPVATYPDGTFIMIWDRQQSGTANRDHMVFIGWHQANDAAIQAQETGILRDTNFTLVDVGGRLNRLPGFAQTLTDDVLRVPEDEPDITWQYMPLPTIQKFMHYILHWCSNALELADFFPIVTEESYPFIQLQAGGDTLFSQINRLAQMVVPDWKVTITLSGQIRLIPDLNLLDVADRTDDVVLELTEDSWSSLAFSYQWLPKVHVLWGSATLASTEYVVVDDNEVITKVKSVAPGTIFGQGTNESTYLEQLTVSQAALNAVTGHRYARLNSPYSNITISIPGETFRDGFDDSIYGWVVVNVPPEAVTQRGLPSTQFRGLLVDASHNYNDAETGRTVTTNLTLEIESSGIPAYSYDPVTGASPDDGTWTPPEVAPPPTVPPDLGLVTGHELLAAIGLDKYIYRTTDFQTPSGSGGPTYDRVSTGISETLYSFVVDPFSPGYVGTSGAINGWIATESHIYRIEDFFGTPSITSILTFGTTAVASSYHWRSLQASFGRYFDEGSNPWLLCISYYGSTAGHEGTWAMRSLDGGATWETEVQISPYYDSGVPSRFTPIAVYTSPKTPGYALTVAYTQNSSPSLAQFFKTEDWGETWIAIANAPVDDPSEPLPRWATSGNPWSVVLGDLAAQANVTITVTYTSGPTATGEINLIIAPPPNTRNMTIEGNTTCTVNYTGLGGATWNLNALQPANVNRTTNYSHGASPTNHATTQGDFSYTFDFPSYAANDWPVNRDTIVSSPPATANGVRMKITPFIDATGSITVTMVVRVTEIVLDDGTTYTPSLEGGTLQPGYGLGGSIHLPWPDNDDESVIYYGAMPSKLPRDFRLNKVLGTTLYDVSPDDGSRLYGANRFGFTIRSYDSNRNYMVAALIGNDSTNSPSDDYHLIAVSVDGGDNWTIIVGPSANTVAPTGRSAYEAAYSGDDPNVIYLWGPNNYLSLTEDGGATIDDRSGNLSSFGSTGGFIGILGGPTP